MNNLADEEFDGFMRGRWPAMVRLAYGLTGDAGHAEDIAQAAFARAYASWGRVRRAGDPDAYVRRIVVNANRSRFRRRRVREELHGDLPESLAGQQPGPGDTGATRSELLAALDRLGPRQRAVIVLRYWLDLSEAETAAALGCSPGTVKSQASRALAGALAVIAVAAGYPALAGNFASAPATPTAGRPAPAHDPKVTDSPPTGTTRAAAGLATTGDVVAAGLIGMSDAIVSSASGKVAVNEEVEAGVVASDVTYLTVTFADGQQLKLIPVPPGGNRYVAWAAPEPMTVASVTAYLGGPYTASGQTETAIPFNGAGLGPSISLWLRPGQVAPPRGQALVGHGTGDGQRWSVTAYEGPWGTCFAISGGTGVCIPELRLATTETTDSTGGPGGAGEQLGSAAPGVGLLRYTLSNGKSLDVTPVTVGNERLFAFWLAKGVKPVSWTAYSVADGRQVGHGKA